MDNKESNVEFDLLDQMYNIKEEIEEPQEEIQDDVPPVSLDDYHIDDNLKESENGFVFLNVFMAYYRKLFYKTDPKHMFEEIDYNNVKSTNRMMEFLYSEVYKYKKYHNDDDTVALYEPGAINIDDCPELYALVIDGKYNKMCRFIVPIITYIADNLEWTKINWAIIPLK